jgi:type I restriction enzyme S subunit
MKEGWSEVALGEVATFIRGVTFKPADVVPLHTPGSVACLRTSNVQAELDLSDVWAIPERLAGRPDQRVQRGDVIISSANSWNLVGKCSWVESTPGSTTIGGFVTTLRANPRLVDARYLYRWFSAEGTQAVVRSFGRKTTNISNLNLDRCRSMTMPLPPLPEQRRIAAILDKADELRAKRRASLALLDSLTSAIMQQILDQGFERIPFGELITEGPKNGLYLPSSDYGSGTPIVRIDSFKLGSSYIAVGSLKRLRASAAQVSEFGLAPGDLVVNRVNSREFVGKTALVRQVFEPTVFESNMMRIRVDQERLIPVYAAEFMQTSGCRRQVGSMMKDAVNQSSINQTDVRSIRIPLPPLEIQRDFEAHIGAIDRHRTVVMNASAADDALFASIQMRAFRGEL